MKSISVFIIALCFFSTNVSAQLSAPLKSAALDSVIHFLQRNYIFADKAAAMADLIRTNRSKGNYDTITDPKYFAFSVTRDLQQFSGDSHIKLNYDPRKPSTGGSAKGRSGWMTALLKENNYGFSEKKILPGNIGYLQIPLFGPLDLCADSIAAAVQFIAETDALIIDLRSCRGSLDENTLPFFCGYLFKEPTHLSDFYVRGKDSSRQFWTAAWVPGTKYLNKPIYILTSGRTFSGGEAFAYDMQQLKRAVLVGDVTRGGAHPTELYRLNEFFTMGIPYARTINAVSKGDWEQSGVKPDVSVKANLALYTANVAALLDLLAKAKTEDHEVKSRQLKELLTNEPKLKKITFTLNGFVDAKQIAVVGSFNFYAPKNLLMQKLNGVWSAEAEVEPGKLLYTFNVDGKSIPDPANKETATITGQIHSVRDVR
jgi:hypothetical protein